MTIAMWPSVAAGKFHLDDRLRGHQSAEQLRTLHNSARASASECVCFDVTNVSNFLYEQNDQDYWDWTTDFPCMAPPFETFWMEARAPRVIRTEHGVAPWPNPYEAIGVTISGQRLVERAPNEAALSRLSSLLPQLAGVETETFRGAMAALKDAARDCWAVEMDTFVRQSGRIYLLPRQVVMLLDPMGKPIAPPSIILYHPPGDDEFDVSANLAPYFPFALALSFLHCKNVTIEDTPDPRTRQGRRADERAGLPTPRYKTLVIEPMRKVLQTEGGLAQNGLKRALHIVRGHFAVYTEDRPLFGKYVGPVWKMAHVRGSADAGQVNKDYDVKPPKGEWPNA